MRTSDTGHIEPFLPSVGSSDMLSNRPMIERGLSAISLSHSVTSKTNRQDRRMARRHGRIFPTGTDAPHPS